MGKAAPAPTAKNEYRPDSVSAPGATLTDVLAGRDMTQTELAERTGRTPKFVSNLVNGKATLTQETALQLERVLQIPASFWNNREQQYREALARQEETNRCQQFVSWMKEKIPVGDMVSKKWLPRRENDADQVREVLDFFGVSTPKEWEAVWMNPQKQAAFRKSLAYSSKPGAVSAWLRYGERAAREAECASFDKKAFEEALHEIRALTTTSPKTFEPKMRELCARAGVMLVFTPQVDEARICGATRWLSKDKALIQQSLRYKTNDQFWFTFFHEAGHVLRHGKRDVFLEDTDAGEGEQDKEEEADRFARDFLIPSKDWRAFTRAGDFSVASVRRFAGKQGIAAAIVAGRLQHENIVPWKSPLSRLKQSFSMEQGQTEQHRSHSHHLTPKKIMGKKKRIIGAKSDEKGRTKSVRLSGNETNTDIETAKRMTKRGDIEGAHVVKPKKGKPYLRTNPDRKRKNNIDELSGDK